MEAGALAPYERALSSAHPLTLRTTDGELIVLDVSRWLSGVDAADETVLARCRGPVLDVGCGPGRFIAALTSRGVAALGVDIAEQAVSMTRDQGLPALLRNVFSALPGEGRWPTVLLMDGNIGIGGQPPKLLRRSSALLVPNGRLIVEADPDLDCDEVLSVQFVEGAKPVGPVFGWARVGHLALARHAAAAGCVIVETWTTRGRTFASLVREHRSVARSHIAHDAHPVEQTGARPDRQPQPAEVDRIVLAQ